MRSVLDVDDPFALVDVPTLGTNAWHEAVSKALAGTGDDPSQEFGLDPALTSGGRGTASYFWGGIRYSTEPRLAPYFVSRYPSGYLLAADLAQEGFELLGELHGTVTDLLPALAKLEGSLALIERMWLPEDALPSPSAVMSCLRDSICRLRQGEPAQARDYLAPFIATQIVARVATRVAVRTSP